MLDLAWVLRYAILIELRFRKCSFGNRQSGSELHIMYQWLLQSCCETEHNLS